MPSNLISIHKKNGIAYLELIDETNRNALSKQMICVLTDSLESLANDKDVKVVILYSNAKVFCAGHNLKEIQHHRGAPDNGAAFYHEIMELCSKLMISIVHHPLPIIAAVEGVATAAGCQLVASCDLAVAGQNAQFCTPGVNIGLFCSTPMVALSRNISRKHALEMLLSGDMISAERAAHMGLINQVVPEGQAFDSAHKLAEKIASKSGRVLKIGKKAFYEQIEKPLEEAYQYASEVMVENMLNADAIEGIGAFVEKRQPIWPK